MKKLAYADSSKKDVKWFKEYYDERPQLAPNGLNSYIGTIELLCQFPHMGRPISEERFKKGIPNTPFAIIYKIEGDYLVITRVKDTRSNR